MPTRSEQKAKIAAIAGKLNELLADYQVHYHKMRAFHWNISGPDFFELHQKFEELYTDALLKIDEIAERILTLRHQPVSTMKEYLATSTIKETKEFDKGFKMMVSVVEDFDKLLQLEKECMKLAAEAGDEGTAEMLSRFIAGQEKTSWMFYAWLKN